MWYPLGKTQGLGVFHRDMVKGDFGETSRSHGALERERVSFRARCRGCVLHYLLKFSCSESHQLLPHAGQNKICNFKVEAETRITPRRPRLAATVVNLC